MRICALAVLASAVAFGQLASNTSLVGNVADSTGAAVSGANVVAQNEGTQETYSTTTNADGYYQLRFLKAGTYTITVRQDGFEQSVSRGIPLSANQTVRTDLALRIGQVSETVEVTADIPPIKTDDASVNELIGAKATSELPLNGRNALQIASFTPGVIPGRKNPAGNPGGGEGYIGAGTREIQNSVSLDGVSIMNNLITTTTYRPSVDAVQEVQVQTGTYPAQYGGYLGVQVNVVTKSGANQFHGALFEFLRNQVLDAKPFFLPQGRDKPPLRQNQFGVQFNGPVWIPKLYDGRNKTFFMFGWESLRNTAPQPGIAGSLTPRMRTGDFGEIATPIVDPNNNRTPFPNNQIPLARLSPQSQRALAYMPLPTSPGVLDNFNRNVPNSNNADQFLGRLDQSLGERHRLFFRYISSDVALLNEAVNPFNGYVQPVTDRNWVVGYTWVVTPSAINDLRVGRQFTTIDSVNFFTPGQRYPSTAGTDLGIPGYTTDDNNPGLPVFGIANYMPIGGNQMASSNWFQDDQTFQISDTFSITKGAHAYAVGFDSRRVVTNRTANNAPRGNFNFNGQLTGNPAADFVLGLPNQITTAGPLFPGGAQQWRYGFFFQDKWQVTQRLTLTYGLRYELPIVPQSTTGNGTILNPEQTRFIPENPPQKIPFHDADRNNWAPRFGFAYRLPSRFVVRGGFGIYYNPNQTNTYTLATTNPPFSTIFQFNNTLTNPGLSLGNPTPPTLPGAPARPNAFHISPYLPNATMNQWSFSVERGLWRSAGVALEYLGSHQYHLDRSFFLNTPRPGPGVINQRRPNPNFLVIRQITNDVNASYNGLSAVFRQQGYKGVTVLASYTWAKTLDVSTDSNGGSNVMDPFNWRLDYGRANWDLRHRAVAAYNYDMPFFKTDPNWALRYILGGWQTNGVMTLQSGFPFGATLAADQANVGQGTQRADIVSAPTVNCGSGRLVQCVSISSFALPQLYTYGSSPRNFMTGPGIATFDMSFFKNFLFTETVSLQFRAEFFNIFNRPNFANPNSTFIPGSTNFGNITATQTNMRQTQFGLKLLF
jgi:hypothetical protein